MIDIYGLCMFTLRGDVSQCHLSGPQCSRSNLIALQRILNPVLLVCSHLFVNTPPIAAHVDFYSAFVIN